MLENMKKVLENAETGNYAVPHFNINNLEWTRFILEECQANFSPVILGVSEGAIRYMGGYVTVATMVVSLVKDLNITIPVVLHLDHGSSFSSCKEAIDAGFTSVMIDASKYPLEENINITEQVVTYAHAHDVTVESEVGAVGGEEDGIADVLAYAKVADAVSMVERTGVDALAPALGSVHGIYKGEPKLDFDRMEEIHQLVNIPLVLHGGSGIPDAFIQKAITCGIRKINVNTELQLTWTGAVRAFMKENDKVYDPRKIIKSGEIAIKEMIQSKIILFSSQNKAATPK